MNSELTINTEATENENMTEEMWQEKIHAAKEVADQAWERIVQMTKALPPEERIRMEKNLRG